MIFRDRTIENEEVQLDGNRFIGVTFRHCTMVFRASAPMELSVCTFGEGVQWKLEGPADLTMQFLHALYHGSGEGGRDLVERTFDMVRRPTR